MFYLYLLDNFGRASLEKNSNSKEEITKHTKNLLTGLDPDTDRYIVITTREIPIYVQKGMNQK